MFRKGQTWSFDLIAAIVIFFLIFMFLMNQFEVFGGDKVEDFQSMAKFATLQFQKDEGPLQFIDSGKVDDEKLNVIANNLISDSNYYDYTRTVLGFENIDYCFYFEDQDGNLVSIGTSLVVGIGSEELEIGGHQCGTVIT